MSSPIESSPPLDHRLRIAAAKAQLQCAKIWRHLAHVECHQYAPLDPSSRQIRLLHVQPSQLWFRPLKGNLVTISLDDGPNYDALSYVWGDPTPRDEIVINGKIQPIGQNLGQALRYMRKHHSGCAPIVIWADGICINQRSAQERSHQVAMMRVIYQTAQAVRIWLDISIDADIFGRLLPSERYQMWLMDVSELDPRFFVQGFRILVHLYWRRLWVQQEVTNARTFRLYFRTTTLSDSSFIELVKQIEPFFGSKAHKLDHLLSTEAIAMCFTTLSASCIALLHGRNLDYSLTSLMTNFKDMGVSDYRDIVYGLMHLADDYSENEIVVDYGLPVQEVFMAAFTHHVRIHGSLSFLHTVRHQVHHTMSTEEVVQQPDYIVSFPKIRDQFTHRSWIRSWLETDSREWMSRNKRASGLIPCLRDAVGHKSTVIQAHGFSVDAIAITVTLEPAPCYEQPKIVYAMWRRLLAMLTTLNTLPEGLEGLESRRDFWDEATSRLLAANSVPVLDAVRLTKTLWIIRALAYRPETAAMAIVDLVDFMTEIDEDQDQGLETRNRLMRVLRGLKSAVLFVTREGHVGIIDECVLNKGDEIWIIFGCDQPMVLCDEGQFKAIVGPAMMPGYMEGQPVGGPDVRGPFAPGDVCHGHQVRRIEIW